MDYKDMNILLIGEGNLSFAYALVKKISKSLHFARWGKRRNSTVQLSEEPNKVQECFTLSTDSQQNDVCHSITSNKEISGTAYRERTSINLEKFYCHVWATTYDNLEEVQTKYPESIPIIQYLKAKKRIKVEILNNVDCVNLFTSLRTAVWATTKVSELPRFHLIYFNNPHLGFEDMHLHRSLLSHFFHEAAKLISELQRNERGLHELPAILCVALCNNQSKEWQLLKAAAMAGFIAVAAVPLTREEFPEYTHRRHQNDNAFPCEQMVQYYFVHMTEIEVHLLEELKEIFSQIHEMCELNLYALQTLVNCHDWLNICNELLHKSRKGKANTTEGDALPKRKCSQYREYIQKKAVCYCVPMLPPHLAYYKNVEDCRLKAKYYKELQAECTHMFCNEQYMPYMHVSRIIEMYKVQVESKYICECHYNETAMRNECASFTVNEFSKIEEEKVEKSVKCKIQTNEEKVKIGVNSYFNDLCAHNTSLKVEKDEYNSDKTYMCPICTPTTVFNTIDDLQMHTGEKHNIALLMETGQHDNGNKQYETQIHYQVCKEMEAECTICHVLFTSLETNMVHLQKLSPSASNYKTFECTLCRPKRHFVNQRALEQHQYHKHCYDFKNA